jgi:hypothetical protein
MDNPEIWDEFRWEEVMREQDRKVDRYMELFYRYRDDPNRDAIIAREMGWTWLLDEDQAGSGEGGAPASAEDLEEGDEWKARLYASGEPVSDFMEFELLPAYQQAKKFAHTAFRFVDSLAESVRSDSAVVDFLSNAMIAGVKIAGGSGIGEEIDELGGNIAYCKRGLAAANMVIASLYEMKEKKVIAGHVYLGLMREAVEVRDTIALHVVELREKFRRGA